MRALVLMVMMSSVAGAQPAAPTAQAALANVQKFYANASQLTAEFHQVVTNQAFGTSSSSDGKLWVAKPSLLRADYYAKQRAAVTVTKTFIFDGTTVWAIDHGNKQILKSAAPQSALPAAVSFLTGGALASQFNVTRAASGANSIVLELTPKQPSAQYKQLFFHVDTASWNVTESIVVDASGDTNDFTFVAPNLTAPVKASWFVVDPASLPNYKLTTRP